MNEEFCLNNELKHLSEDYRMSYDLVNSLLDERITVVGSTGKLYLNTDILCSIPLSIFDFTIDNFTLLNSSEDYYQVSYNLIVNDIIKVCTASWIKRNDWRLIFFQITPRA